MKPLASDSEGKARINLRRAHSLPGRLDGEFHEPAFVQDQFQVQRVNLTDIGKLQVIVTRPGGAKRMPEIMSLIIGRFHHRQIHSPRVEIGIGTDDDANIFLTG